MKSKWITISLLGLTAFSFAFAVRTQLRYDAVEKAAQESRAVLLSALEATERSAELARSESMVLRASSLADTCTVYREQLRKVMQELEEQKQIASLQRQEALTQKQIAMVAQKEAERQRMMAAEHQKIAEQEHARATAALKKCEEKKSN